MEKDLKIIADVIKNHEVLHEKYLIKIAKYKSQLKTSSNEVRESLEEGICDTKALLENLESESNIIKARMVNPSEEGITEVQVGLDGAGSVYQDTGNVVQDGDMAFTKEDPDGNIIYFETEKGAQYFGDEEPTKKASVNKEAKIEDDYKSFYFAEDVNGTIEYLYSSSQNLVKEVKKFEDPGFKETVHTYPLEDLEENSGANFGKLEEKFYAKFPMIDKEASLNKKAYNIQDKKFTELPKKEEGLVLLGAGGDLKEWVVGITKILKDEGIAKSDNPDEVWGEIYKLNTTGGRTDLVLMFKGDSLDIGKMAMWRIRYGDASWLSDYLVNYAEHHGVEVPKEKEEDEELEEDMDKEASLKKKADLEFEKDKFLWKKESLEEAFVFLDELRDSGVTNMFGGAAYLADEFNLDKDVSRKILKKWMDTFGDGTESAIVRAKKALELIPTDTNLNKEAKYKYEEQGPVDVKVIKDIFAQTGDEEAEDIKIPVGETLTLESVNVDFYTAKWKGQEVYIEQTTLDNSTERVTTEKKEASLDKKAFEGNDLVPGGLADKDPESAFNEEALKKGMKVEMEHTNNKKLAKEIASDHLNEDIFYYDKLEKLEKGEYENLEKIIEKENEEIKK